MGKIHIGIEGGATHSTVVVLDDNGAIRAEVRNQPPTNHWIAGMDKCCDQLVDIIQGALELSQISGEDTISSLGLCLSGCEDEKTNEEMRILMQSKMPNIETVRVASDTYGAIFAVSDSGGVVLISGTGSNCLLVNPDKSIARCGGWSYMIGDEGSAWWMAHKAVKLCVDELDNYEKSPYDIEYCWTAVKEHFNANDTFGLLKHCYVDFNKPFFAELTLRLKEGADLGDAFCKHIFHSAGVALAKLLVAVSSKIDPKLFERSEGLPIVCVGSVWKSWNHLEEGFTSTLSIPKNRQHLKRFSLLTLKVPSALGAAFLAAPDIPHNYSSNAYSFFSWSAPETNGC